MKKQMVCIFMICCLIASLVCACGNSVSDNSVSTDSVSSDTSSSAFSDGSIVNIVADSSDLYNTKTYASSISSTTDVSVASTVTSTISQQEVKFIIVQDARDNMFTLTSAKDKNLVLDSSEKTGYKGNMTVLSGSWKEKSSGYYMLDYSKSFTLSDMDEGIVYVSVEYPYVVSVAVQNAAKVILSDDRTVEIVGKDKAAVFSYNVWLSGKGATKESKTDSQTGKGSGTIKLYCKNDKLYTEQVFGLSAEAASDKSTFFISTVDTVTWEDACPWADKIYSAKWSDGAVLANIDQLKSGILSAKFTPVDTVLPKGSVSKLTFYDEKGKALGKLNFWTKGNHVEIDGNKYDYDTFGLDE